MSRLNVGAEFGQVTGHHVGVGGGQHQGGADTTGRTHGAEDVGPFVASILGTAGTRALARPAPRQGAVLADPGLILPPQLDRLVAGRLGDGCRDQVGEVFLCASTASAS